MQNLKVTLIQQVITPNDPQHNLDHFSEVMGKISQTDLIVLPEVFTTGFCAGARNYAEAVNGRAFQWMHAQAQKHQAVVTGSLVVKEDDSYFNRLVWMRPDGSYEQYDKRHLFRMAGEHTRYAAGARRLVVELKGWRMLPLICYDLRFPVWSRNCGDYDAAIYVANWPSARSLHWNRLLQARAIENLSYVIGVNRVGMDEAGQHYTGDSTVYGPVGELIVTSQEPDLIFAELNADHLQQYRTRFPAQLDMDKFELQP